LEAQWCNFSSVDGGIKVTNGSLIILKEERTANMYKIIGSVIVGGASATMKKEDTTRLWHLRFGHVNERDLQALHNKRVLPGANIVNSTYVNFTL